VARLIYPRVSARLGQSIVIENRGGATGSIGEAAVARSDPDGYTLMHDAAAITVNPSLLRGLTFDVLLKTRMGPWRSADIGGSTNRYSALWLL
jgi:tripartite-type tricarboxylate transporter receptor subunit TctC